MREADMKRQWDPMRLTSLGLVSEVVQAGGGKLSPPYHDPGEPRKPPGTDNPHP